MMFKKKKKDEEESVPVVEEKEKPKRSKKKILITIIAIVVLLIGIYSGFESSVLITKKDNQLNDQNMDYLNSKSDKVSFSFLRKDKGIWTYSVCSKKTLLCMGIKYDTNDDVWLDDDDANIINNITFTDYVMDVFERNNVEHAIYSDNDTPNDIAGHLTLIAKRDNSLMNAIFEINNSSLIDGLCDDEDNSCIKKFEIDIFNGDDYDIIAKKTNKRSAIAGYKDLYEILFTNDDVKYESRLGQNIERHNIDGNMFNCNSEECNNYVHIAYRYAIGNHNHVGSTMIVEGVNAKN